MKVSLSQAAKDTEVSLPTLSRWRKKGRISAQKNGTGGYLIDTSEYDIINDLKKQSPNMKSNETSNTLGIATHENKRESNNETTLLSEKVKMLEERLKEKDEIILDLKVEKEDWKKQAQTLLLKSPDKPVEKRKGFFGRLVG